MTESTGTIAGVAATEPPIFADFKKAVTQQFTRMTAFPLFRTEATGDDLWETYLSSFPEGTNPLYRKRATHDCSCCRQFIRSAGNVVAINDGTLVSIWDIAGLPTHWAYQVVAEKLALKVRGAPIANRFLHDEPKIGTDTNREDSPEGDVKTWSHFHIELPRRNESENRVVLPKAQIGPVLSEMRAQHDVLLRSLTDISVDACNAVFDLIEANSLYRGEEHRHTVTEFLKVRLTFDEVRQDQRDLFVWQKIVELHGSVSKIRNTSIGSLLLDLSEGRDLEEAVNAFERMVAPQNYRRSTALVTKAMVDRAEATVDELGLTSALERRFATLADISVNNVIWADRSARQVMRPGPFDGIATAAPIKRVSRDGVQEVPIDVFLKDMLPGAETLEVMVENRHAGNFVSLIAPVDPGSKSLFQWENRFSWSYSGDFADSIRERVKKAGGSVAGDLCCRLAWCNYDDLDLHMIEPGGYEIYYMNRGILSPSGGTLDVDMNATRRETREPVENIFYQTRERMGEGTYRLAVHQFAKREATDVGFEAEIDFMGDVRAFHYPKPLKQGEAVEIATIRYSRKDGIEYVSSLPSTTVSRKHWNVDTQTFRRVNVALLSPNHWDGRGVGNRHYFFMLDGCRNDGFARGFYNEFLHGSLAKHRKVFEFLGAKMRAKESPDQLSGLGFSSTQRNDITVRVSGTRVVRVTF